MGAAVALGACGGAAPARLDVDAAAYRAGEPAFVLDAAAVVRDSVPGLDVLVGVAPAALVFRPGPDSLEAVVRWTVSAEREGGAPRVATATDTVRVATAAEAMGTRPVWRRERFDLAPGRYTVRALLDDDAANRAAERRTDVLVPVPGGRPRLGALRVSRLGEPLDATALPAALDSVVATLQATDLTEPATLVLTVSRVRADSVAAASVRDATPFPTSLAARGIDRTAATTVHTARAPVEAGTSELALGLPALRPGVYQIAAALDDARALRASRLVVVRRRDYPLLTRLGDLVEPLVYLAGPETLAELRSAPSDAARRRAFDRFWGTSIEDRRLAAATVRAYYERVEEANRLFAGPKEGWMTDPGMVFILFGPPRFVEARLDGERWTYGAGVTGPVVFTFRRTSVGGAFRVLTLDRDRTLADEVDRARRQWRRGVVP